MGSFYSSYQDYKRLLNFGAPEEKELLRTYRSKLIKYSSGTGVVSAGGGFALMRYLCTKNKSIPAYFQAVFAILCGTGGALCTLPLLYPRFLEDTLRLPDGCKSKDDAIREYYVSGFLWYPNNIGNILAVMKSNPEDLYLKKEFVAKLKEENLIPENNSTPPPAK